MYILFQPSSLHCYKVKIINPRRKSDAILRYLHHSATFTTAMDLRMKMIESFKDLVPENLHFNVGYFEGQQHSKIWLGTNEDFAIMYKKYPKGEITLWCDGCTEEEEDVCGSKKMRKKDTGSSKRQEKEADVDDVFTQLKEKHGQKYELPKLRLWARTICGNLHDDMDTPPDLPVFHKQVAKKARQESLTEALSGAAVTFAKCFKGDNNMPAQDPLTAVPSRSPGFSPGKTIELRMKNYEQLRYLQQLVADGILTEKEYGEQKEKVLLSLKKLN